MAKLRPIPAAVVIRDYQDFVAAVVAARQRAGMKQLDMDARAGLPDGYTGKLEIGAKSSARNARGIGRQSLPLVLGALDVDLVMVPRGAIESREAMPRAERARLATAAAMRNMTPEQRRERARKAARARWESRPSPASPLLPRGGKPGSS